MFETERLIQELATHEIDCSNIVVNNVVFPEGGVECKIVKDRRRFQNKYLQQFQDLYEDCHLSCMPLQREEVTGVERLKSFGQVLREERDFPDFEE